MIGKKGYSTVLNYGGGEIELCEEGRGFFKIAEGSK